MLKLHKDRKQTFECKIRIEGADLKDARARLVLSGVTMDYALSGRVDAMGNCMVEIPPLKMLENKEGTATLEVMVDNGFFEPFRTEYKLVTREVTVTEVKVNDDSYRVRVHADVEKPAKKPIQEKVTIVEEPKKSKMFIPECTKKNKIIVKNILEGFNSLDAKNTKTLKEHISFKYAPSKKVVNWADKVFINPDTTIAKMVMYKVEDIIN